MTLELSQDELEALQELIRDRLTDLGVEIHRTDRPAYREKLEDLQATLLSLQRKLESSSIAA
jgi:hypothetical protein